MKVAILGAASGMGRAIAQRLAERGDAVCVLGIGEDDLQQSEADLRARAGSGASMGHALCDLERPESFAPALDHAEQILGGLDAVIVTAAMFAPQERLEQDLALTQRLLTVNYAHTVLFCEHARQRLLARGGGKLVVFSSVAGDRGRKPQILYGSSKAGLALYLEALDHKFYEQGLRVLCVKPGFVKTGMTAGLKPPPFAGEPDAVAKQVIAAMDAEKPVVYTPSMWALVMLVIRWLPRFVMRKINF